MLRAVIQRPIAVSMLFVALVLIGVLGVKRLPVDLLPSITHPRLTVITEYPDIPADDLQRLVTRPIEEVVTALSGVRRVVARTRQGLSLVTVEYEWGTRMDFANLHLREAIDRVAFREDFPEAAERPVILRWDPTSRPISILVLTGSDRMTALTEFAEEVVKPALEQVPGISQAEVVGGARREILVEPDPQKLAVYGITMEEIRQALARNNITFPGGRIRQGPLRLSLRIAGEYGSLDEIARTEISRPGGGSIRVSDVARVADTVKEAEGVTLLGETPVVSLLVYKEPEANTLDATLDMDRALDALKADYGEFAYRFVYRDADYVRASFDGLKQSLIYGSILAFLVLFLFLHDFVNPFVVGVAIPVSIAITFGLLYFTKVKLNLMSLGGLSLAAGMLVDNAIVVLENINRHLREDPMPSADAGIGARGVARRFVASAAATGTGEVARAVLASTFTTVAVFFPVVYVPGIAGAFFRDQALTVTLSLLVSVLASLLLQPMLAGWWLRPRAARPRGLFRVFQHALDRFETAYHARLERVLRRPYRFLVVVAVGLALCTIVGLRLDRRFMPERSGGDTRLDLELPAGTPLEETAAAAAAIGAAIQADPAVAQVFTQVGQTERTLAAVQEYAAPHTARMRIILKPMRGALQEAERLQLEIARRLDEMADVRYAFREEGVGLAEILASGEAPFTMGVIADDPVVAATAAEDLARELKSVRGLREVNVDRVIGTTNVVVHLDREEILRSGLDPEALGRELRDRVAGVEATTFNEVEQRIDIAVRLSVDARRDLAAALDAPISLPGGERAPLRAFVTTSEDRPVRELVRRDQRPMVSVTGEVVDRSVGDVWNDAMSVAAALSLPPTIRLVQGGEREAMQESFDDLGWAMLLAVLLVYMILAAQFESFLDPLLISAVLPIGLGGAALALAVTGDSINILSMIGTIALCGVAVNDAIVKVDAIRRLREEGMSGHAAVLEASRIRVRPIIMNSATAVLGMIPMAIGIGTGAQLQGPLAITIIGGLTLTTITTIYLTPVLYEIAHGIRPPEPEDGAGASAPREPDAAERREAGARGGGLARP
jgi:HAE1 family hydrophobic/amphiphilic exporter-1